MPMFGSINVRKTYFGLTEALESQRVFGKLSKNRRNINCMFKLPKCMWHQKLPPLLTSISAEYLPSRKVGSD